MAIGIIAVGGDMVINVATTTEAAGVFTPGAYSPVDGLTTINRNSTRNKTATSIFGRAAKIQNFGPRDLSYTLNGLISVGDSGQDILRAAEASNDVLSLQVLFDGTNGFNVLGRVGGGSGDADPDSNPKTGWEFATIAVPELDGTGPIW